MLHIDSVMKRLHLLQRDGGSYKVSSIKISRSLLQSFLLSLHQIIFRASAHLSGRMVDESGIICQVWEMLDQPESWTSSMTTLTMDRIKFDFKEVNIHQPRAALYTCFQGSTTFKQEDLELPGVQDALLFLVPVTVVTCMTN